MKKVIIAAVAALAMGEAMALNSDMYAAEAMEPVRPGGVNGSPFWNICARGFIYPPAFDFSEGDTNTTVKYRFTVLDSEGKILTFDAPSNFSSLAPVWNQIANGRAWVYLNAVDKDGEVHGIPHWPRERFLRTFWKKAAFRPGAYEKAPRSYSEAISKCGDMIFNFPTSQSFLKTGKPDVEYQYNCYPSKIYSALILAMVDYAKKRPDCKEKAMKIAESAADYLEAKSFAAGTPLEYWPLTYADKRWAGAWRLGQVMLCYPCEVGTAYLEIYNLTKDAKRLEAAKRIAQTYLKLQEADGTWPVMIRAEDGKIMGPGRLQPVRVMMFLDQLFKATGEAKYRDAADRAFKWVEEFAIKDWNWEGQFEDVGRCAKYENTSEHMACDAALYVLERWPNDKKWIQLARDILRYAEDQFVFWEKPAAANGHGINTPFGGPDGQSTRYDDWFYPCALEQYVYYVPVDASSAKMIRTYLALYRAEKNPLDLEKARALADGLVRTQDPNNGFIPTEYAKIANRHDPMTGWLNCTAQSFQALIELDNLINNLK